MILFWQFTIKTLEELDIVSNQNLSVEMLLVRLMYLSSIKSKNLEEKKISSSIIFNENDQKKLIDTIKKIEVFRGNLNDSDICFITKN